jgi:hypothetical protein
MGIVTLTPELIRNIYKRIEDGETQQSISNYYKISRGHVSKIKAGMSENPPEHARWSHLYPDYLERKKSKTG